ncbi:hypothetical protein [Sporosarcina sp. FSL K6-3457]|uniref:hypothetical protein n=1 Tax=Sporosarcina sp. FSL K6-3457 TaxID=2978204 RepID=UPI0030F8BF75
MNESLSRVLIGAKELNKWVAVKHLTNKQLRGLNLIELEDTGLLLVHRHAEEGMLMKLTLKGYLYCKN